jgi:hypothetical protein
MTSPFYHQHSQYSSHGYGHVYHTYAPSRGHAMDPTLGPPVATLPPPPLGMASYSPQSYFGQSVYHSGPVFSPHSMSFSSSPHGAVSPQLSVPMAAFYPHFAMPLTAGPGFAVQRSSTFGAIPSPTDAEYHTAQQQHQLLPRLNQQSSMVNMGGSASTGFVSVPPMLTGVSTMPPSEMIPPPSGRSLSAGHHVALTAAPVGSASLGPANPSSHGLGVSQVDVSGGAAALEGSDTNGAVASNKQVPGFNGGSPSNRREREEVARRMAALDYDNPLYGGTHREQWQAIALHLLNEYEFTDDTERTTSKDFVRLCVLKDELRAVSKVRITVNHAKEVFRILKLVVTGEWDRRGHGGVRGPWVYGVKPRAKEN